MKQASVHSTYSTTRLTTNEKPTLKQKPEYKLEPKLFLPPNLERKGEGGLRTKGLFKRSYENKPLISIVTVVYNGEKHLEQTIKSVLEQDYDNVEYIIIDGGSTDGTLEIIKKYEEGIDYWVSEADGGIYDAMNKGASLCSGEYVAFLNADDWYKENTLALVVEVVNKERVDFLFANADIYSNDSYKRTQTINMPMYYLFTPFCHQTLFVRRMYMLQQPFDIQYKVYADQLFIIWLIEEGFSYYYIEKSIVNFRDGGLSTTDNYYKERFRLYYKQYGLLKAIHYYLLIRDIKIITILFNTISKIKQVVFNTTRNYN